MSATRRGVGVGVLLIALASACVTPGQIGDAADWPIERSMVVGRVQFVIDGERQDVPGSRGSLWGGPYDGNYRVILHREGEGEAFTYKLQDAGFFFWALEPGSYRIAGIERATDGDNFKFMELGADFTVPSGRGDFYLVTFDLVQGGSWYGFNLTEEPDAAEAAARARYPGRNITLSELDLAIETEVGNIGMSTSACSSEWSRECTRSRRGVSPISPPIPDSLSSAMGASAFTRIKGLSPTFRWAGSSDPEVAYDLIVYEAIQYRNAVDNSKRFCQGRVVLYEEGIADTSFRPMEQLETNSQYFWSVRYRKGSTVSDWSTYSYSAGIPLVLWSSAGGLHYGFATPEIPTGPR